MMDETILASIIRRYESITFLVIEPLYFSFCHYPLPPSNKILVNNGRKKNRKVNYLLPCGLKNLYSPIYYLVYYTIVSLLVKQKIPTWRLYISPDKSRLSISPIKLY